MDIEPVPERQDFRGFFLNWVAVFAPEAYPLSLSDQMAWMENGWGGGRAEWRMVKRPFVGATLFALTGSTRWLRIQFNNFDYGGSQLRSFYHRTLALIAPRLTFDQDLIDRLGAGLQRRYFVMAPPLVLYAVSRGEVEEKRENLRAWQTAYPMNPDEAETVASLLNGDAARNPLQSWLLRNTAYVALRLGSQSAESHNTIRLPIGLGFAEVWSRIERHPLMAGWVKLQS
jgi:hypothetical protein